MVKKKAQRHKNRNDSYKLLVMSYKLKKQKIQITTKGRHKVKRQIIVHPPY